MISNSQQHENSEKITRDLEDVALISICGENRGGDEATIAPTPDGHLEETDMEFAKCFTRARFSIPQLAAWRR